jgi:hypothetical protein
MFKIKEMIQRANHLLSTGNTRQQAATKLSAEFPATAYMNGNNLWARYDGTNGKREAQVIA